MSNLKGRTMSDIPLKNYREVGSFDLLSPPLTPLNLVDGQLLNVQLSELIESGAHHIVLDCSGLDYLYSDTLTVLGHAHEVLLLNEGTLGVMTANDSIASSIRSSHLASILTIYPVETDLIQASMKMMAGAMPEVAADGHEDDHTLEVFEEVFGDGFENVEMSEGHIEKPAEEPVETQESTELNEVGNSEKNTAAIQILQVEEEYLESSSEVSKQMNDSDSNTYVRQPKKLSFFPWLLILFIILIGLSYMAYNRGMV